MNDTTLLKTGAIGAVVATICCATPVLVIAFGALGLSALTGYLDYVLLPIFALSVELVGYGFYRRRQGTVDCCATDTSNTDNPGKLI